MNKLFLVIQLGLMLATQACEKKEERILPKVGSMARIDAGEQSGSEREKFIRQTQREMDELAIKLLDIRQKAQGVTGRARG